MSYKKLMSFILLLSSINYHNNNVKITTQINNCTTWDIILLCLYLSFCKFYAKMHHLCTFVFTCRRPTYSYYLAHQCMACYICYLYALKWMWKYAHVLLKSTTKLNRNTNSVYKFQLRILTYSV